MEQISVIGQIFKKYFEALEDRLNREIIENLRKIFERGDLTEANLNEFIKWLEDYNAKDKKS